MDFKLLSILPPVLSKFALFINRPKCSNEGLAQLDKPWGGAANLLETYFTDLNTQKNRPLILRNITRLVSKESDYCNKLDSLVGDVQGDFLMRQGWVYLGEPPSSQADQFQGLTLNLTYGSSSFGENFHLGFQAGKRPASSRIRTGGVLTVDCCYGLATYAFFSPEYFRDLISYNQRVAQNLIEQFDAKGYTYELAADGDLPAQQNMRAYCTDCSKTSVRRRLGWHRSDRRKNLPLPPRAQPLSSVLKLLGDSKNISPTIVFGRVSRGFMRQVFIYGFLASKPGGNAPLQLARKRYPVVLKRADVLKGMKNNIEFKFLSKALGGDDLVKLNASGPAHESYNQSNRRILSNYCEGWSGGNSNALRDFKVSLGGESIEVEKLGYVDSRTSFASSDGKQIFAGDLKNLLSRQALGEILEQKKTFSVSSEDFPDVCLELKSTGKVLLNARGITKVVGSSLELPPISGLVHRGGGILLTDGNIVIKGNICAGGSEPLTLVSLSGDIVIEDGCTHIEAGLVAIEGTLRLPKNKIKIRGPLALNELDFDTLLDSEEKLLEYDARFDISQASTSLAALRIYWDPDFHIYVTSSRGQH